VSAADVTDGNGEEVARGGSDEDAVWQELIGRFDSPADSAQAPAPWPERENLFTSRPVEAEAADQRPAADGPGEDSGDGPADDSGPAQDRTAQDHTAQAGGEPAPGGEDLQTAGTETAGAGSAWPWPDRENLPPPAPRSSDLGHSAGGRPGVPAYRRFELPAPADPRSWTAPDEDEDEGHYTPPPPPPLPSMTPVTKGAWVALFGGPGYLLTATLAGWSVAGWALFLAIAAFVGGFTVLALRLGDRPDDGSGPDDGAVV
jgi:hypothetical protein